MSSFHERFLGRLPPAVLKAVARRMGVEGADEMSHDDLVAALAEAPGQRAASIGRSLRKLVGRLPGGVLKESASSPPPPRDPRRREGKPPPPACVTSDGPAGPRPETVRAEQRRDGAGSLEFETITMVDVLLRQGHPDRARTMLRRILDREPDNAEARRRMDELEGRPSRGEPGASRDGGTEEGDKAHPGRVDEPLFRPHTDRPPEPLGLLDFEEPPMGYDRVYAGLLPVEPTLVYSYWEVTPAAVETVRRKLGEPDAPLALRFVSHHREAPPDGAVRDVEVPELVGEFFFVDVTPGSSNRMAVGVLGRHGRFEPVCHTGLATTAAGEPSTDTREVWLDVEPPAAAPAPEPQPIRVLERTEGPAQEALVSRARRIGLGGLPEDTQQRLLGRLQSVLRSFTRPGALPTSPGMAPHEDSSRR